MSDIPWLDEAIAELPNCNTPQRMELLLMWVYARGAWNGFKAAKMDTEEKIGAHHEPQ
jgi:hypothetical protein